MLWILWLVMAIILVFGFVVFKGAPYVPSKKRELTDAFETLYPLGEGDVLVDIGSGDGIVLREAAKHGARAIGYELNPVLVGISRWLSRREPRIKVHFADFWKVALPLETTVVYVFGESRDIAKMAGKVAREADRLAKPLTLISYGFAVPGKTPAKKAGAYFLYTYTPLQTKKA